MPWMRILEHGEANASRKGYDKELIQEEEDGS